MWTRTARARWYRLPALWHHPMKKAVSVGRACPRALSTGGGGLAGSVHWGRWVGGPLSTGGWGGRGLSTGGWAGGLCPLGEVDGRALSTGGWGGRALSTGEQVADLLLGREQKIQVWLTGHLGVGVCPLYRGKRQALPGQGGCEVIGICPPGATPDGLCSFMGPFGVLSPRTWRGATAARGRGVLPPPTRHWSFPPGGGGGLCSREPALVVGGQWGPRHEWRRRGSPGERRPGRSLAGAWAGWVGNLGVWVAQLLPVGWLMVFPQLRKPRSAGGHCDRGIGGEGRGTLRTSNRRGRLTLV